MTALRQKMIAAMRQRGFAQRTHNTSLIWHVISTVRQTR